MAVLVDSRGGTPLQYGHLRTSVPVGYAARSRDAVHDLLHVETARATIDTVADLNADLEDGVGISGPADNPNTLLMCVYKRDKALCHRDIKVTPSLDRCIATCANIARTDQHAADLRRRATALDQRAAHVLGPLGERLRNKAARLRDLAHAHHCTRITLQDGTT